MTKDRGFKKLKGVTISKVDASCVNMVALWDSEGKYGFLINAEVVNGVPVMSLTRIKNKPKAASIPERKLKPLALAKSDTKAWPFPLEKDPSLD